MADLSDDSSPPVGDPALAADPGSDSLAAASRDATPSVLVVVVAHDPGEWFDETLESIATQDYPRLEVVVVDAAGTPSLGATVHAHLPNASVLDAADTEGFSAAANTILDTTVDPAFILFCHDDVALGVDTVRQLVVESLRSNAGITGPKIVDWDQLDRLQHVAYTVDRFAVPADVVDIGELDQEQYDAVGDVFAVPSACLMIRTGLFRSLRGFDPGIGHRGEDVDLCWRAQLAGARVLVVPDARVRHREDLVGRTGIDDVRRTRARHQLRTVMVTSSRLSALVTLPLALLLTLGESAIALFTGRFTQVRDVWLAWVWNLRRLADIRRRRRALKPLIRVRHADIRALQQTGSVRINAFIRGQIGRGESSAVGHEIAAVMRTGTARISAVVWALIALFVVFGSRSIITGGVPAIGDFVSFGASGGDMFDDWWSGWRDRDMGGPGATSLSVGVLGLASTMLGGTSGLVRTLWVLLPVGVGLVGAWRMMRVSGSRRAQIGALLAYTVVPLPWAAIAAANIGAVYSYAAAPWILTALLHAQAASPFRTSAGPWRSAMRTSIGLGSAVGVAAAFDLSVLFIVPSVVVGLLVAALLTANPKGTVRLIGCLVLGSVVTAVLVLPVLLDLLTSAPTWEPFAGGRDGSATEAAFTDILRFGVGPEDPQPFLWALAVPLAIPVLLGRSWRFGLAIRGWSVALVSWGLVWAGALGRLPFGLPDDGVLLAPAAAGMALVCGAAVVSFEHDLRGARFGWRQALLPVAMAAAVMGSLPTLAQAESGRWGLPDGDYSATLPFADPFDDGSYRVLWIGAPEFIPGDGRPLVADLAWTASLDGPPLLADRALAVDDGAAPLIRAALTNAFDGDTMRLGRELGGLGVRYVVLLERLAPAPFSDPDDAVLLPPALGEALAAQLDLRRLEGINSAMVVYANTEWTSVRAAATSGFDDGRSSPDGLAAAPLSGTAGVMAGRGDRLAGSIPDLTEVFVAQTSDSGWSLEVDGAPTARRKSVGYATAFLPESGGVGELAYATPLWRQLALLVQVSGFVLLTAAMSRRLLGRGR